MNKLFVLAHPRKRFEQDFSTRVLNSPVRQSCSTCKNDYDEIPNETVRGYYWDTEFGHPIESLNDGHECFWGEFKLIVSNHARERLSALGNLFAFNEARETPCAEIPTLDLPRKDELAPYFWVNPKSALATDRLENQIDICPSCGKFRESAHQVTRICVSESSGSAARCFTIRENRAFASFVTSEMRHELESIDVKGIGFYPAGRLV